MKASRRGIAWGSLLAGIALLANLPVNAALPANQREIEGAITQVVASRRGASTLTVKKSGPRGDQVLVLALDPATKVMRAGKPAEAAGLKAGETAKVVYRVGTPLTAVEVTILEKQNDGKPSRPELSAVSGEVVRVTARDITVKPPRGAELVTLALPAGVTILRNGESAKPNWLLVGDRVVAEYLPGRAKVARFIQAQGKVVPRPPAGKPAASPKPANGTQPEPPPMPMETPAEKPADQPAEQPAEQPSEPAPRGS